MTDVLEELTADTLSREHVERRLDDWTRRIDDLYARIAAWVAPELTVSEEPRAVQIDGEPMREVGAAPRDLPVLDLLKNGERIVSIEPRGLWIIGANGRLDLTHHDGSASRYFLVDSAQNFAPPQWRVVSSEDRTVRRPLDKSVFLSLL
jgi:hypothetical protein